MGYAIFSVQGDKCTGPAAWEVGGGAFCSGPRDLRTLSPVHAHALLDLLLRPRGHPSHHARSRLDAQGAQGPDFARVPVLGLWGAPGRHAAVLEA